MTTRRSVRARAYAPDPAAPGRCCDLPGCGAPGEYRAPKSRRDLREYWWFCLEHVRAYNSSWDYYKGMSPAEMEQELRADTAWQRPSWPLGRLGSAAWQDETLRDPLHILATGGIHTSQQRGPHRDETPSDLREPLSTLGLTWPTTLEAVKSRYKELAKRHHPDANGGSRDSEERLKTINLAYATLRTRLVAEPRLASAG
jgi:DnaJ-domain-containing protein 1